MDNCEVHIQKCTFIPDNSSQKETETFRPETTSFRPSFDDVLQKLGNPGRFQLTQIALLLYGQMMVAFAFLSFVFLGFEPPHVCNSVNETALLADHGLLNDSTATVHYQSCDMIISSNQTGRKTDVIIMSCPEGRNFSDKKHTSWMSHWDLVCESRGLGEMTYSGFIVGWIAGGLLVSSLADRYGRKVVLLASYLCCFCAETSILLAPNVYLVIAVRILSGLFCAGFASTYLVMCTELIVPRHREVFGAVMTFLWILQLMAVGAVAFAFQDYDWRFVQGAVAVSALASLVYPFWISESPRWLTTNKRYENALKVLRKACHQSEKDFQEVKSLYLLCIAGRDENPGNENDNENDNEDFNCIYNNNDAMKELDVKCDRVRVDADQKDFSAKIIKGDDKTTTTASLLTLLCHKDSLVLTLSATLVTFANLFIYNGMYMTSSALVGDRFLNYSLMCLLEVPSTGLMYLMIKRTGRLRVLRFFFCLNLVSLLSSSLLLAFSEDTPETEISVTVFFMLGLFAITSSYSVSLLMRPEIFPTSPRSTGGAFVVSISSLGLILVPYLRPFMAVVTWGPAVIFTALSALALILTSFLPETKDRELLDSVTELRNSIRMERKRPCK